MKEKINEGILNGNLYLLGGGDPGFVSESLWNLVNNLKRTGLKSINGDLIVDASRFQEENIIKPKSHFGYDSRSAALSFNWNTVNIYLKPAFSLDYPLQVHIDPFDLYFSNVENTTKTVQADYKRSISVYRREQNKLRESLYIAGRMPLNHKEILIYRNVLYPSVWSGWNAVGFLKQRGINLTGTVKTGKTPAHSTVIAEWESRPLTDHIKLMMKYSNNFMVEMLIKNMVTELKQKRGNIKDGIQMVKNHITKLGIQADSYQMVETSGLSRQNRLKPQQLLDSPEILV